MPAIHRSQQNGTRAFPNTHLWMVVPLIIATTGFYFTYWSVFSTVPFHQHLHALTATAWYVLLVVQPWIQKRNSAALHRKVGFVGLFLAGAVVFSALQIVRNNLTNDNLNPVLRYGLTWGDLLFLAGFSHAVLMAMWQSKNTAVHARYMIASAIWALLPALSRLIYFPLLIAFGFPPPISFLTVVYCSSALLLMSVGIAIATDHRREGRIYTSYVVLCLGVLSFSLSAAYMGTATWWISMCERLFA
jgi:hypothetical protein